MAFWNSSYNDPFDYTELWAPASDRPPIAHNVWRDNIDNQSFSMYCYSLDGIARDLAGAANPNDRNVQEEICARYGYSLNTLTDDDKKYIEQAIENF